MTGRIVRLNLDGTEYERPRPLRVARYIFKLKYAMRSLPIEYAESVGEEVCAAIDEAAEHHLEAGYHHGEAYARVLSEFMSPERLGKKYVAAYHRRPEAVSASVEAAVLLCASAYATATTVISAHGMLDVVMAAALAFVSLTTALRLAPINRALRLRQAALHFVSRGMYLAMPAAAGPALASVQANFSIVLSPPSLAAHFSLSNFPTSALISVSALLVLERSRRALKLQRAAVHRLLNDQAFAASYFRTTNRELEERKQSGYFTESLD